MARPVQAGINVGRWLMTYSTLMVHVDLGQSNEAVLGVAADLAERFKADVVGIAACQPMQIVYAEGYFYGDMIDQDRARIEEQASQAETSFRLAFQGRAGNLHWRSTICLAPLADYIAENMRSADLLITASARGAASQEASHRVDLGELVIRLGRPALIVPPGAQRLDLDSVIIGWKDTRETRRAVVDALPLLRHAGRVTVAEVASEEDLPAARARIDDVAAWLKRHGVAAHPFAAPSAGDDAARLDGIALEHGAGLLVAGAYGHNRLREWALGGVTRSVLKRPGRCSLLSH